MRIKLFSIFIFLGSISLCQINFEKSVSKVELKIKIPPPDSIKPTLTLNKPVKLPDYPIYSREPIYSISGNAEDDNARMNLFINDAFQKVVFNEAFKVDIALEDGKNILAVKLIDKRGNYVTDTLLVAYDPNADIEPPILKLLEPKVFEYRGIKTVSKFSAADSNLLLKGRVYDKSSLIGVWVNKEPVELDVNSEFSMYLLNDLLDTVYFEAADKYGNLSVERFFVTPEDLNLMPDTIRYHALIISINDYKDNAFDPLDYPIKNGEDLASVLTTYYTFEGNNVKVLKNPSRESIHDELLNLRNTLTIKDNLLIFYAGHGYFDSKMDKGYWIPSDATGNSPSNWVSNSEIRDYIRSIKTKHTLLISDACFSGNFNRELNPSAADIQEFNELYRYTSRHVLSSGSFDAKVPDKSVFNDFLVKFLKENGKKILTGGELSNLLKGAVRNNSIEKQIPQYQVILETGDEDLGDFIFVRK